MIKDSNIQICIIIPKEINEKLKEDAKTDFSNSRNSVARRILIDYYKNRKKGEI